MGIFDSGKVLKARCVGISNEGYGVARIEEESASENGMKVFVEDMLPGEKGQVRLTRTEKNVTYAVKLKATTSSENRVEPVCPEFLRCGGCQLQHASYSCQLRMKENLVRSCLVRLGHFPEQEIKDCMEPILGAREMYNYRNQMQYPVEYSREKRCVNIGLYERNTHKIVEHENCYLADPSAEIVRGVAEIFFSDISRTDEARALRQVVVRSGVMSKELMVIFVIRKQVKIDGSAFATACDEALKKAGNGMRMVSIWTEERPSGMKWKKAGSNFLR